MPVTGLPGGNDWLQSLLASLGASQPYGQGGAPGPYSGGPNGLMPGGQLMGYHGTTPGQPSMGYPATGQPQPPNAAALGAAASSPTGAVPGMSLGGVHGGIQDSLSMQPGIPAGVGAASPGANATATPGGGALSPYLGNTDARGAPYPAPMPPARPKDLGQTAGMGEPQGSPSATPRPANSKSPNLGRYPQFSTFQYETPNSSKSRAPIYTALNLFGRG